MNEALKLSEPNPGGQQWAQLSLEDRDLLVRLLAIRVEFVDSPLFHVPGVEEDLFGSRAVLPENATRFAGPAVSKNAGKSLGRSKEARLFLKFNYARMRQQELTDRLSDGAIRPDEIRLMLAWARRAMELRERIVEANMPIVMAMLRRFRFEKRDPDELISEGEVTLLRCVDKFDCSRGYKFSTYTCRSILKCFARVGANRQHRESRCLMGFDPELEPSDFVDRKHEEAESEFLLRLRHVMLTNGARLTARERFVIRSRFLAGGGTNGPRRPTLNQVGMQIGVTRERIRQIEDTALRKLRRALDDRADTRVWSRAG